MSWVKRGLLLTLGGVGTVAVGCAGSGAARRQNEPSYQTPPLPAWSPPVEQPPASDPSDDAVVPGGDLSGSAWSEGEWVVDEPEKPPQTQKSVDLPPEEGQNSSTAPSDRGTVAPPQSD